MVARNFAFSHLQSLYVRSPATYIYIRCNNRLNQRLIYSKHRHCLLKPPSFCTGKNTHLHVLEVRNGSRVINFNCSFFFKKNRKKPTATNKTMLFIFWGPKVRSGLHQEKNKGHLAVHHLVQSLALCHR